MFVKIKLLIGYKDIFSTKTCAHSEFFFIVLKLDEIQFNFDALQISIRHNAYKNPLLFFSKIKKYG